MQLTSVLFLIVSLFASSAQAGVVVGWSPGVVVFDPYTPEYVPEARVDYIWIPGGYDEYGYFVPGHWQPVAGNPGFVWAAGYWSGRHYHDGYWRPIQRPGQAWVDGYYVRGRYQHARWVRAERAEHVRAEGRRRVQRREPPTEHAAPEHRKKKK